MVEKGGKGGGAEIGGGKEDDLGGAGKEKEKEVQIGDKPMEETGG